VIVIGLGVAWYLGKLDRLLPTPAQSTSVMGKLAPAYVAPPPPTPVTPVLPAPADKPTK
jgi:hypothetical protein